MCFRGAASRQAGWAKKEEKEPGNEKHLGCVVSGSQRGAASKYQLQCGLLRAAAAWLSQMQTVVRRDQNKNAKRVSEKGGNACCIKRGFVSLGNVSSVPSSQTFWKQGLSHSDFYLLGSLQTSLSSE